ncbi:MAG: PQQ-binding-like beta-propeller repeat protein, partial [Planctomycetes bacterium]|nr:PQQ-binding-like beta-propeller repeat protein [Planctomycetota bacterium]
MWSRRNLPCVLLMVMTLCQAIGAECLPAADWPTYRGNRERSNYTAETLSGELSLAWQYDPGHAPQPAWSGRDTRTPYDRAYQPVVAGGLLLFGSSADCQIHALDAATGSPRWTFITGGPVRFAPVVWEDRVLAASDDGHLYCLAAADGRLVWEIRGGPDDDMVLGNGRMVSRWPARGGPVVADGVVYFGAGIWPSEGIFVYAVDARSGKVLWCNSDSGGIYMPQPHGGANAKSGISAHGDLVVAGDVLLVPTGRAVPAALNRSDGKLLYFHLQRNVKYGGSDLLAADGRFINRGITFDVATGNQLKSIPRQPHRAIAALPGGLAAGVEGSVKGYRWATPDSPDSLEAVWSVDVPYADTSLVIAGQTIVSAGKGADGHGVCLVDLEAKKSVWSARVDAAAWGLAVADGRLYVSTEDGTIYCFQGGPTREPKRTRPHRAAVAITDRLAIEAAEQIVPSSGVTEGYCVDLGCGDGALAIALVMRTNLKIYAVDPDPKNVAVARKRLCDAGLYGVRVTVHQGDPAATSYPNHFANLVVSARSLSEGAGAVAETEVQRLQRPYGGVACLGKPGAMKKSIRGPLEGAGSWTHQYCNPANTNCSSDERVKGPLGMLWFNDLNFAMPSRHGRGHAPLVLDGRLFVEGLNGLRCVDPYNGRTLWEYP